MLLINRKSNISVIDPYDPSHYASSRRWLSGLLIWPLPALVVILTALAMAVPALGFSDASANPAGAPGADVKHPAAMLSGGDGQSPTTPSDFLDDVTLWSAVMTVSEFPRAADFYGYSSHESVGALDTDAFVVQGNDFKMNVVALSPLGNALGVRVSPDLDTVDTSHWILLVDGLDFSFGDAGISPGYEENETLVVWDETGLSWDDGQQVSLRLIEWEPGTCPVGEDAPPDIAEALTPERTGP